MKEAAKGGKKQDLMFNDNVSSSQVVNHNGLPTQSSLFKEPKESVTPGVISQSNSSSKIGNKKSPKFVQINL